MCHRELDQHASFFREVHAVVRLWECLELTGVDLSDGPYPGWEDDAVKEVQRLRHDHDKYAGQVDRTAALLDQTAHDLRTFEP